MDISSLGEPPPIFPETPVLSGRYELLGVLYVVEGAANGGKVIFDKLNGMDDPKILASLKYFQFQAESQETRWRVFKDEFLNVNASLGDVELAILAAKRTFLSFAAIAAPLHS